MDSESLSQQSSSQLSGSIDLNIRSGCPLEAVIKSLQDSVKHVNNANKTIGQIILKQKKEIQSLKADLRKQESQFVTFRDLVHPFFDKYLLKDAVVDKVSVWSNLIE